MILQIAREDILGMVGSLQLCAGQEAACESSVLVMKCVFEDHDSEAVLFVDASIAFNSLNRQTA